ncbi:MAG: hypothetical protein ACREH8_06020 [Opitutaceae bacterium]
MNPQNSPTPSAPAGESNPGGDVTEGSGTLSEAKAKITQTARDATAKVKDAAGSSVARAKEQAERFAAEKKETTANRIRSYSSAIHDAARSLEEQDPNIAWYTHRAADRLQGMADYMRNRDFSALRHDAEDMARRHPAVFFGGMFLAGFVVGNIVKASRRKLDERNEYAGDMDYRSNWNQDQAGSGMYRPEFSEAERPAAGI